MTLKTVLPIVLGILKEMGKSGQIRQMPDIPAIVTQKREHPELQASLGYMGPCLKSNKKEMSLKLKESFKSTSSNHLAFRAMYDRL